MAAIRATSHYGLQHLPVQPQDVRRGGKGWRPPWAAHSRHCLLCSHLLALLRLSPLHSTPTTQRLCMGSQGAVFTRKDQRHKRVVMGFHQVRVKKLDAKNEKCSEAKNNIHILAEVLEVGPTRHGQSREAPFLESAFLGAGSGQAHPRSSAESRGPSSRIYGQEGP